MMSLPRILRLEALRHRLPIAAAVVLGCCNLAGAAQFSEPLLRETTNVPLPSSALMGLLLIGGIGAFARFPTHKRKNRRRY